MTYSATANFGGPTHSVSGSHNDEAGRRCAIGFNPGGHVPTAKVKAFHACAMKAIIDERAKAIAAYGKRDTELGEQGMKMPEAEFNAHQDALRGFATALTHLESAQMFAVKALHTKANAGVEA